MGGYVAGPVMAAAIAANLPLVIMEPNALPGAANRLVAKRVYRALLGFESTRHWFPPNRAEITGVPVRPAFFEVTPKQGGQFTVLITGGSRGARTLNRAARESWPLIRQSDLPVRMILQTGSNEHATLAKEFERSGVDGAVVEFIRDMPAAFADADLVIGRSGAGGVNEVAAAGMPSILVPFPFAADNHQQKNAEMLAQAGAARLVLDHDWNGSKLVEEVEALRKTPDELEHMRQRVRAFAHPDAADRAAAVLVEAANHKKVRR
jgi:UDP-N-acetylglucosamine--N-acetylmuramyl-(pentapeptide) pyrophosphoryl-undecaprenol N-acetylglucosamine transferase